MDYDLIYAQLTDDLQRCSCGVVHTGISDACDRAYPKPAAEACGLSESLTHATGQHEGRRSDLP